MPYLPLTEITYKKMRFLITHSPSEGTLSKYIEQLEKLGVTTLVRVCDATYDQTPIEEAGIQVLAWPFTDGSPPPEEIVDDWLNLIEGKFRDKPEGCVAVHCASGLGRSAVLVAVALIEYGMKNEDAVQYIRLERRGAFSRQQLHYLEEYQPKMPSKQPTFKDANNGNNGCCCVQ
ncbi:protein tyrosine phosphatase type IVA 2-like [Caloenas nicobarica]|uniref:protein tyrosine phosphatase type IVA 2-like n=1 Tax=Caloenas nicobarica TaxID=187106 RepID=UPI0032B83D8D